MINKIRILMILLATSVAVYAGYSFLVKFKSVPENVKVRISKEGVDVEIKNFQVIHENEGRKEWELKAKSAQINQADETTKMRQVEFIFINENDRKFQVFADSGILQNKTKDLDLEGHVKMIIESAMIGERFKSRSAPSPNPQP
ncbi:hypothetical protein UZ36_05000 [Candidatus Nitromaritima sp. SCGC AAA799-C22]|nr:hypothetical protein UZ36_05000 [Candidatus Nitromaritima sp. SCGC AAA799-C22]